MAPDNDHTHPGLIDPKRLFAAGGHSVPHGQPREHVVQSGETLAGIASSHRILFDHLRALNPGLFDAAHHNGNLIHPGEVVHLS